MGCEEQTGSSTPQSVPRKRKIRAEDELMKSPAKRVSSQRFRPKWEYGTTYGYASTDWDWSYPPYIQSILGSTNSTADNSMSIPEQVLSPHNQKSTTPQGGPPDLGVSESEDTLSIQPSHPALAESLKMPLCLGGNQASTKSSSQDCQVPSSPNVQETHTQKLSSSQHADFSPGCDTLSWTTDDSTD